MWRLAVLLLPAFLPGQERSQSAPDLTALKAQLGDPVERTRWQAIHACVKIGAPAVPMLTGLVVRSGPLSRDAARAAAAALVRIGPAAVPCLAEARRLLNEGDADQRDLAFELLGWIGPHDPENAATYRQEVFQLMHPREKAGVTMHQLVQCILRQRDGPPLTAAELVAHLEGDSAGHIEVALDELRWFKGDAEKIVPVLRDLVTRERLPSKTTFKLSGAGWGWSGSLARDHSAAIRGKAAFHLVRLAKAGDVPPAASVHLVADEDPAVRRRSVLQLGALGAEAIGAAGVAALRRATGDVDKLVAWDAITVLGMLGPAAKDAVPELKRLAEGSDKAKAARAKAALRAITGGSGP